MSKELAKAYDPSEVEDRIYDFWMKGNYFHAEPDPKKKPYTIVIPPPNITGQLHMGHALDETFRTSSSAGGGCRAIAPCGCRAPTTPPLPPRPKSWRPCAKRA